MLHASEATHAHLGANDVRESGQSEIRLAGSYKIFAVANGWQGWALDAHAVVLVLSPLCLSLQCQYFAAVELCCSSRLSLTLHIPASLQHFPMYLLAFICSRPAEQLCVFGAVCYWYRGSYESRLPLYP